MNRKRERNHTIDIVKAFLIVLVLITHYGWTPEQRKNPVFPFVINMAIPCFMVITGYVYSQSLIKNDCKCIENAYNPVWFFRRILRYTIPFLVIVIWEVIDPRINNSASGIFYLRWFLDGATGPGSYYYPVMIQIVFLFPIIYFIIERKEEKGLLICLAGNAIFEVLRWSYFLNGECYRLLCFRYIFLIAAGVYIAKGYRFNGIQSIVLITAGTLFILATEYWGYTPIFITTWASTSFIASMIVVPFMAWILQKVKIQCAPIELIGRATYNIFLVQMVYYSGYYEILESKISIWQLHLITGIIICLVIGTIFYLIESRFTNWVIKKILPAN